MLHGGETSVVLYPALGGKIREITLAGRQWLWHNPRIPLAPAEADAPFATVGDSGGLDECFPTVVACRIPTWVAGAAGVALPDHGELWSRAPEVDITTNEGGQAVTCRWTGSALPYRFTRTVTVGSDGTITFAYAVENQGAERLPFLWAAHPVFPLTPRTRIVLPTGARTRVVTQHGVDFGGVGSEHRWPKLRSGATLADLSRPDVSLKQRYACQLFVDLPRTETTIALEEGGARLEIRVHGREMSGVGLWLNRRGWAPPSGRRSLYASLVGRKPEPYRNCSIEPCLGAPDFLADALGTWDAAQWLESGTTARWSMTWRGARE